MRRRYSWRLLRVAFRIIIESPLYFKTSPKHRLKCLNETADAMVNSIIMCSGEEVVVHENK